MIVAIDGPAGSGKSTTSKLVASKLGISYLNTGLMYRAMAVFFLDNNFNVKSKNITKILNDVEINISDSVEEESLILNGVDITKRLKNPIVTNFVSSISSNNLIRNKMVSIQRRISNNKSIVIDGRDIGTVVFPGAEYKFFITASIDQRTKRMFYELKKNGADVDIDSIKDEIIKRDHLDTNRRNSPLKKANDAIIIDTTDLTIDEQVNLILTEINKNN